MNPGARFRLELGIFADDNPKNQLLCPYKKRKMVGVGANPGKFTRQRNRPKDRAGQSTHPGTGRSHRKTKRNRELPINYPKFPIFATSFYHRIAYGILTAPPGFVRAGFLHSSAVERIPCPYQFRQFRPILAHIIVRVKSAAKAGFQYVTGHRFWV